MVIKWAGQDSNGAIWKYRKIQNKMFRYPIEDEQSHSVFIVQNIIVQTIILEIGQFVDGNNDLAFLDSR